MREIPATLRQLPNWVCWKNVVRDGKPTKVPFDAKTGLMAKANDPSTWASFDEAFQAADALAGSEYSGIGFQLGNTPIVGIDCDGAIDKKGIVDPYVLSILHLLGNPYTEKSPNGRGLHAFVECETLPQGARKISHDHTGIEIYHGREGGRYLTCTGEPVLGEGVPKIEDISLPYLLITQNRDKKFKALWLGDTSYFDGDESSADMALMNRLAVLASGDAKKMEKYFGASALGQRDKWKDREDYRQRTLKAALEYVRTGKPAAVQPSVEIEFHTPSLPDPDGEYVVAPAEGQEDGWFPLGDISLVGGASGTGKTTLIFEMLHKQKQGWPFLDHKTHKHLFHVLAYDRGQNAFIRTMRRLKLSPSDIPTTPLPLAFGTDAVQNIINEIEKMNPIPGVIFVEGMDMLLDDTNKKSTVSPFMRQMQEVAAHFHIALIGSLGAPKTKRGEDYAAKRDHLSGSEAWGRNCETVAILEFAEEDDGTAPQRVLTVLPRNAKAEKFDLQFEGGRLVPVAAQPEEEPSDKRTGRPSIAREAAIRFLEDQLQDGPKSGKEIQTYAQIAGISAETLRRACIDLRVNTKGTRVHGSHSWSIPECNEQTSRDDEASTAIEYETTGSLNLIDPTSR